ncbi:hypothetical protein [uncultured Flavobacterium sp.]|uniref:hypothetical protein n=1 Tax=uncultured Flavobacterium sp. TaxID=165435 RepID=UPI0025FBFC4D|nr:hypothetical protein [uncultured Flavobacterium sp.]
MDNQDKLYKQFQEASQKAPEKDFPSMEKVWGRVEEKLDKKALTKESKLWKKIAVAASVLLIITLGSQFLKLENDKNSIESKTEVVTTEENKKSVEESEVNALVSTEKPNPIIKENAAKIMEAEVKKQQDFVASEQVSSPIYQDTVFGNLSKDEETYEEKTNVRNLGYSRSKKIHQAVGVQRTDEETSFVAKSVTSQAPIQKKSPLYVINGEAVKGDDKSKEVTGFMNSNEIDSIEVLTEPLYIINGVQYSEEELFGPNPTSPYSPLNKQEILSTKILKGVEATSIYGEKGKKGVVIITTKNSKPLEKKK